MARYEHLPIYKQAMDVAVHVEKVVAGFSRYHKYSLGTELRQKSREIVARIIRANGERDKAPALRALRGQLEELLILIRLAKSGVSGWTLAARPTASVSVQWPVSASASAVPIAWMKVIAKSGNFPSAYSTSGA